RLHHVAGVREFLRRHRTRHVVQLGPRFGIAVRGSQAEPHEGMRRTLRYPLPPAVHHAKKGLRLRIPLLRQRTDQPDRRQIVATVVSRRAIFPGTGERAAKPEYLQSSEQASRRNQRPLHPEPPPQTRPFYASGESRATREWGWTVG